MWISQFVSNLLIIETNNQTTALAGSFSEDTEIRCTLLIYVNSTHSPTLTTVTIKKMPTCAFILRTEITECVYI